MVFDREGQWGLPLDRLTSMAGTRGAVYKDDLRAGDTLKVQTMNSCYTIRAVGQERYLVSGGWFERNYSEPVEVSVKGCTWGGTVIRIDVLAVCGLCIEFGNRIVTSAVQRIVLLPKEMVN